MNGLMMDYQLTIDSILEHANRMYRHKRITTMQPDGSLHRYTYGDMYGRVKRLANALTKLGIEPGDRVESSPGTTTSTVELENAIMAHPLVLEAAVIAIPDQTWLERPLAAVVPTPDGENLTGEEIQDFLADKVAKWWIPEKVVFIKEIPKTSVGKFDKKRLRWQYAEGQLAD